MLNHLKLIGVVFVAFFIMACGGSAKETKGMLTDKKLELEKLKKEQSKVGDQVKKLEEEIAKLDTTIVTQAKLVAVTTITPQNFAHYIDLRGEISAEDISYIAPRGMGGQVKSLFIKQGDLIRKGQLILKLDDAIARQQVASAKQQAEGVKVQLELAKDLYKRQKNLWEQGIGTEVQLLNAKNAVDGLENQVKLANEGIKLAQEQLSQSSVYSNVSGIADIVNIKVGEMFQGATAAGPQIRIVNNSRLKAVVQVPENYISSIKKGTPVVIEVGDVNKTFNATISFIGQSINASSRAITAEAKIPSDPSLKINQIAIIKIRDYAASNALVVPLTTIQNDVKGKYVFVMSSENGKKIAKKKAVVVGEIYGEQIEVKSGLNTGDILITQGYQGVYDGQVVTTAG